MAKINDTLIYGLENLPDLLDFLIGSKKKNGKTMNFSLQSIINLINGVNGKNVIQYKFFNEATPDIDYTTPGAFFTNNNETDVNNFSSLLFNKKTLGNYDLSILFDFLSGLGDLFIGIDNPSNPNNFFTLRVTSISNQIDYFIFNVVPYNGLYIGELSNGSIYSLYWETKEWISQIDDINSGLDSKLDHGGYPGTGQDLKNEIDTVISDLTDNYYTKPEIDGKISSVYRFRGNVANYAALPTVGLTNGDVYNALDTDINWAWTGTVWDNLGGTSDISGKEDKSNKQNSLSPDGTGQKYLGIDGAIEAFNTKLDKGTYTGNAGDLKSDIDSIFVPDQLISGVAPIRSVNTFTYPALGYIALISKTLRTNQNQFPTTIAATSTSNHKRVDLIYFKPDNTLAKLIGTEDLIIAPRPDVPDGCVGVSFINVFGDVIENPTPITNEISIQDYSGVEKFRITDYLRFKGVSFDANAKALVTDPLVPLAAFLDPLNGNDVLGVIENSNKPFKTLNALLNSLPASTGETYTIYITGGVVQINRIIILRNLRFVAYKDVTLDFTNTKNYDGITEATRVFDTVGRFTWTFENENISIVCNYVGIKAFTFQFEYSTLTLKGTLNTVNWKSRSGQNFRGGFYISDSSDLTIINLYNSSQNTVTLSAINEANSSKLKIINYYFQYERNLIQIDGAGGFYLDIDNMLQIGTASNMNIGLGFCRQITIGNIVSNAALKIIPYAAKTIFKGTLSSLVTVDLIEVAVISGEVDSVNYLYNSYLNNNQRFENFKGRLGKLIKVGNGKAIFSSCTIETDTYLLGRAYNGTEENCVEFNGFNSVKQNDLLSNLFQTYGIGTAEIKPISITINGTLKTNATTYGENTSYFQSQSTFKEKLNEVVIRNKTDLINKTLSSYITYIIDGVLDLIAGEYIIHPLEGLTIIGYGFDVSQINKNITGESIFKSPVGGSGNFVTKDMQYNSGLGKVFDILDSDGSHAVELNDVNFNSCASIGKIKGYRQFTGTTCGVYGCGDGFQLSGNWSGFKFTNSNIINFLNGGTLIKKDTDTLFSNRLYLDINFSCQSGAILSDFSDVNFSGNELFQINNTLATYAGSKDADTNTTLLLPNITPNNAKSRFSNCLGITESAVKFKDIKSTDGNVWRLEVSNAGALIITDI